MASNKDGLTDMPDSSTKRTIVEAFWGSSLPNYQLDSYWDHYRESCEFALRDQGRHLLIRTHQDILDMVAQLKSGISRAVIRNSLRSKFTRAHHNEDELLDRSIDLASTLLLMVDFGDIEDGVTSRQRLHWNDPESIRSCISSHFNQAPLISVSDSTKLQRNFNALNLARIAGIDFVPTTNLLDHLRLTNEDTKVYVFHCASFLKLQPEDSMLPKNITEETIRTLALLFPQTLDPSTRQWYRKISTHMSLDPQLFLCGKLKTANRQIETFSFWRDRLVILKQAFDDSHPQSFSQWFHDRRNGVQWYTFWVAMVVLGLTLLFGLIQSIEGAIQVWASLRNAERH
ncbi:hypothetical protein BS50DRAFT_610987 [Corynespora cassiicola Philippines]|uniref:Uncharacterized protein n=1 Tax=Corynespora cassiicola Philippines TaxID=1448308 RepID=A0A2T2NMT9_CORCC|nr:hypothetical protein BS50DRAFT_610987 [Corynespora cassiicola Philippines]